MNDQARQLLLRLIRDYGTDLVNDPQRLNALLKDYARGQFKREIFLCVQAAREGTVLDLLNNQHLPLESLSVRLSNQLQEDYGLDSQAADWAIETWLIVLGLPHHSFSKKVVHSPASNTPLPSSATTNTPIPVSYLPKPQPSPVDDVDLVVLVEDGISWLKNLVSWQKRYVDNHDGTITDSKTGLQWMRCSLGQYWNGRNCEGRAIECTLQDALNNMALLNSNPSINYGYSDWRMPTWDELTSIRGNSSQVIDRKAFPDTPDSRFWTITESTSPDLTGSTEKRFYTVNFNRFNAYYAFGTALAHDIKFTRLVR
jgi:hypothetical protein